MSNNKIPDCCVARIHQRLIHVLDLKERLADISYLCCDDCRNCYRLTVKGSYSLRPEIYGSGYDIICESVVDTEGDEKVKSGFQTFAVPSKPEYYRAFKFIYYDEEPKEPNELKEYINEFVKHL